MYILTKYNEFLCYQCGKVLFAPTKHSAEARIHFSFKIAPEQNVGSAVGGSERYLITNNACHGKSPTFARSPFAMRGVKWNDELNSFSTTYESILNYISFVIFDLLVRKLKRIDCYILNSLQILH